jgi:hypothetical protein
MRGVCSMVVRPSGRTCLLLLVAALATGCGERAAPTAIASGAGPRFDFADNPSSPSPIIIRRDGVPVRVITADATQNLMAIHGPVDDLPVCSNSSTRDLVDGQQIQTPSDVQGIRLLLQASDTHVEIYSGIDLSAVFPFDATKFCAFVANTPKAYEGIVAYHVNLGSSMASFRREGNVTRVSDGALFHYVENQDVVAAPGTGTSKTTSSYIRLSAIGGR